MTKNQIEYAKLLETKRANSEAERLTALRDSNTFTLGQAQLQESSRHNIAAEQLQQYSLDETSRHNKATEALGVQTLLEQQRRNLAQEAETNRANLAREQETMRANVAAETERNRANIASEQLRQLELSQQSWYQHANVAVQQASLSEQTRSNKAREAETRRSNMASEEISRNTLSNTIFNQTAIRAETQRSNIADETIRRQQLNLSGEQMLKNYDISLKQANVAQRNATVNEESLRETQRSTGSKVFQQWSQGILNLTQSAMKLVPLIGGN